MKAELNKGQHSVYLLTYHPVLVVKYRRKAITEQMSSSNNTSQTNKASDRR